MTTWLIRDEVGRGIAEARSVLGPNSARDVAAWEATVAAREPLRLMKIAGATAQIDVSGVLTAKPDFWAEFFGEANTAYPDISAALAAANADPSVKEIVLNVSSPGGTVDGLFETLGAIRNVREGGKKMRVVASQACSAAYAIAAMAGPIEAATAASEFGSVGVVVDYIRDSPFGSVTNTDSPNKRPNLDTEEGRAVLRERLDAHYGLFVETVASGRGMTVEQVTEGFGHGAVFIAADAKKRNMIDRAPGAVLRAVPGARATAADNQEKPNMDMKTLMAEHPELYAAAVQAGVEQERERVCAHLTLAEASGAMNVGLTAIKDGSNLSVKLQAEYMAAGMNRRDAGNRGTDDGAAANALNGTSQRDSASMDMQDRVAARLFGMKETN